MSSAANFESKDTFQVGTEVIVLTTDLLYSVLLILMNAVLCYVHVFCHQHSVVNDYVSHYSITQTLL